MRLRRTLLMLSLLIFSAVSKSQAQIPLYSQVSAETNAMGGAGVSFVSDNALAIIANPAELGLFSLKGAFTASYTPTVPDQLNAFAFNTGLTLNRVLPMLPFKVGFGIAYSNPNYSYVATGPASPVLSTASDRANGLTFGVGADDVVKLGLGYTLRWVTSNIGLPVHYHSIYAPDFGIIVGIPVVSLISRLGSRSDVSFGGVTPVLNLAVGYAQRNAGDYAPYAAAALPREANLGWNIEVGLKSQIDRHPWKWLSLTLIRQASASLVLNEDTAVTYEGV